jgi:lipopolysaccharide export system permease protein
MTTIDRYLLRLFFKVLVVSFVSLAGLAFLADMFGNLDEFFSYGAKRDEGKWLGTAIILTEYYSPRLLWFFDRTAGLLAMLSAVFVLTWMQRTNELTALMAAGISPARLATPLLIAAVIVSLLGAINRELGLPHVRDSLSRNAQDWLGESSRKCTPKYDIRTDVLIAGKSTFAKERRINEPLFRLPPELSAWGRQIVADHAYHTWAAGDRPEGYLLRGVKQPANLPQLASAAIGERLVLLSPADTPWLSADECFVVSVVTFEQIAVGGAWRRYLSSYELVTGLRGQTIEPGADVRLMVHARVVQPLLDMSLVLLGIPLVLRRGSRNIFLSAGLGAGLVAAQMIVVLVCHALGVNYLLKATLAAWLPLLVFGPIAYTLARPLWD